MNRTNAGVRLSLVTLSMGLFACGSSDDSAAGDTPSMTPAGSEGEIQKSPETEPASPNPMTTGECDLNTAFDGDELCILPPPEAEGFQVRYGPSDYDDPDEVMMYMLEAGGETNLYESTVSANTEDVFFYKRQYRMRPGSHHLILTELGSAGADVGLGRRLGGSQNKSKDTPSEPTPENVGIGMPLQANAPLLINLHHFNGTNGPILKEAWINVWYVDPSSVTQEALEMYLWAQGETVAPGASFTVKGSHAVDVEGRVLTMHGHRHSNTTRFSAYRTRGGVRELVYDDYDWFEPTVLEFNSVTVNPEPNADTLSGGGLSGIFDVNVGDLLEWECEIVNARSVPVTFGENEAETSEMCILIGDALGPSLRSGL